MKPFRINRKSWHYRMNNRFLNEYSWDMRIWEANHGNFCSYWRATVFRLIALIICAAVVIAIVMLMLLAFIYEPIVAIKTISIIVAVFSLLGFITYLSNRPTSNEPPTSLLAQRYRAYKDKVCPMIEYDK
jgi:peptidoglycan/LPS O-acetylase OafA/YrhL